MITFEELHWNCTLHDYDELKIILSEAFNCKITSNPYEFTNTLFDRRQSNIHTFIIRLNGEIIGTATVCLEKKLIHNSSTIGRIEEVAIKKEFRNNGYGIELIKYVIEYCKEKKCRKIILNCSDENIPFYQKCGFEINSTLMAIYFK